jgi:predicted Rossmann fold flavoprotein
MAETCDIAINGAGAAGLAAAIFAGETAGNRTPGGRPLTIEVLESAPRVGAKILISGGGRCNVTHCEVGPGDFNGARNPIRNILAAFDADAAVRWFDSIGVRLKREETGKLFPVSDSARTVVEALLARCERLGVRIRTGRRVADVRAMNGAFALRHGGGAAPARHVIMATGGKSLPRTGSDGSGWEIVRRLGHTVTDTYPALVPFKLAPEMFHAGLSGISAEVELSVMAGGKPIDRRRGSMLWTHFGMSGPVVMDVSRHWIVAKAAGSDVRMYCNFIPGADHGAVEAWMLGTAAAHPRMAIRKLIAERMPERLAAALADYCGVDPSIAAGQLPRERRHLLIHALTRLELPVVADRGWNFAEVTAGGVPLNEIDHRTMESRRVSGLYMAGEMLDCDGRIGGFNFQWAWATGYLAGRAAAESAMDPRPKNPDVR